MLISGALGSAVARQNQISALNEVRKEAWSEARKEAGFEPVKVVEVLVPPTPLIYQDKEKSSIILPFAIGFLLGTLF